MGFIVQCSRFLKQTNFQLQIFSHHIQNMFISTLAHNP